MKLKLIINWNTMTWLYVTPFRDLEEDFNVMDQPDDLTLRVDRCDDHLQRADRCDGCLVPRSIGCYNRYRYSAPIAVTIAVTSLIGTICSKWPYRLISYPFKMKKYALYSS
ncbi:hypothetical protein L249_4904 [Ophiocordyceps polyrhachis-furcata BCC 54312]|uniref:Uncharacterized protein n=1 Tax=Ophiocordyceps polyrhachis-furcata BCC 54312 TaxID=1330021 RepID=A0A367L392_9HYPO|nr:hypothetical protein L249_4904 [Ophiocordyceps polyrhachis-furcata BCC 54312]